MSVTYVKLYLFFFSFFAYFLSRSICNIWWLTLQIDTY